jgi:DNA-directed RNA polymerase specialized sigma24 family protein
MSNKEFEQAYPRIRSKVIEGLGSLAEDAFQEIAYRASTKAAQFKDEEELLRYIWKATNQELRRDMARADERTDTLWEHRHFIARQPNEHDDSLVAKQTFDQACEGLTEEQKAAVWEILYDGAGVRDTELPKSTVHRLANQVKERMAA